MLALYQRANKDGGYFEVHRRACGIHLTGTGCDALAGNGASTAMGAVAARAVPGNSEELEVNVSVKDGGMMLVTALTPDLRWQSGAAELSMRVHGSPSHPQV